MLFIKGVTGPTISKCINSKMYLVLLVDGLNDLFFNLELIHTGHFNFRLIILNLFFILEIS